MTRPSVLCLLALAGCVNTSLVTAPHPAPAPRDDRFSLEGEFCTAVPSYAEFPLRVLFVVDVSQSMDLSDPADPALTMSHDCAPGDGGVVTVTYGAGAVNRRMEAVQEVMDAYPPGNGLGYGIITFSDSVKNVTQDSSGSPAFLEDYCQLYGLLPQLGVDNGETAYDTALDRAYMMIQTDLIGLGETARSRSHYVVVFMSDGLPDNGSLSSVTASVETRIENIMNLMHQGTGSIKLHTVYLQPPSDHDDPTVDLSAEELLSEMALAGGGTFRVFQSGEAMHFFYLDFTSLIDMFTLKQLLVTNTSARAIPNALSGTDSDGDGLLDSEEIAPGTNPLLRDTDGDGLSDYVEVKFSSSGFNPLFPGDADCTLATDRLDDDGDGLNNCEERLLGTDPKLPDTDGDGVPDDVEFHLGTNPTIADFFEDLDFDGAHNGLEVVSHTDPTRNDVADFSLIAYRYDIEELHGVDAEPGRSCYHFEVDNITLVPTLATATAPLGTNTILVRVASVPMNSPNDSGDHLIACVQPRYRLDPEAKDPPDGKMTLARTDFKNSVTSSAASSFDGGVPDGGLPDGGLLDPEVFNALRDCVKPQ